MSSGTFRISSITVPAFSMRFTSSLSLSPLAGDANAAGGIKSNAAARYFVSFITFLPFSFPFLLGACLQICLVLTFDLARSGQFPRPKQWRQGSAATESFCVRRRSHESGRCLLHPYASYSQCPGTPAPESRALPAPVQSAFPFAFPCLHFVTRATQPLSARAQGLRATWPNKDRTNKMTKI